MEPRHHWLISLCLLSINSIYTARSSNVTKIKPLTNWLLLPGLVQNIEMINYIWWMRRATAGRWWIKTFPVKIHSWASICGELGLGSSSVIVRQWWCLLLSWWSTESQNQVRNSSRIYNFCIVAPAVRNCQNVEFFIFHKISMQNSDNLPFLLSKPATQTYWSFPAIAEQLKVHWEERRETEERERERKMREWGEREMGERDEIV